MSSAWIWNLVNIIDSNERMPELQQDMFPRVDSDSQFFSGEKTGRNRLICG